MSVAGSSRLVDPTVGGSSVGKASTSDGNLGVGPASPSLQFRSSTSSFSPDSVLDGSTLLHHELKGQQKQVALASVDNANSSKRQKVPHQTSQRNNRQAHVMQTYSQQFNSLDNTPLPCLINDYRTEEKSRCTACYQHQQKSVNHRHLDQQLFERCNPPMPQYALQQMNDPFPKEGNCANWFRKCMADKRNLIHENSRQNWEQFVEKYFSHQAKIRWCFSSYSNGGNHSRGVFPQIARTELPCDLCHSSSGNGFVVNVELLPMLDQIKYSNEVIDELWSLDMLHERQLSAGLVVLGCNKAVQMSVYEQFRVVHSGRLQIVVTSEMKILNWEFCARHHEVLVNNNQVRQVLQVAQNYQASLNRSGSSGISREILEASCKMFVAASRSLARSLDPLELNDWGFSSRYSRCLQMSQVANSMKGLMDFSQERKLGPLGSYKIYQQVAAKLQYPTKQKEQLVDGDMRLTGENKWNKAVTIRAGEKNLCDNQHANGKSSLVDDTEIESIRSNANVDTSMVNLPSDSVTGLARKMGSDGSANDDDDEDFLEFCNSARFDGEIDPANQK